ncbi:hypothetical protein VTN00DRAFT_2381 [Thermoascus crustaceus]|uniref:uncharacterized protein n=1 Tax=Thermoascus crustaceus TaxID=5088 RepID=UPI00374231F0
MSIEILLSASDLYKDRCTCGQENETRDTLSIGMGIIYQRTSDPTWAPLLVPASSQYIADRIVSRLPPAFDLNSALPSQ